jgi:hypothetical protein
MELLLNLTWLAVSIALGALLWASRSESEAMSGRCLHPRATAWVGYVILIALLLPAISMTDDLMAMVAPTDGEQIARRYDAPLGGQHPAGLHITLFQVARYTLPAPLAFLEILKPAVAQDFLGSPIRQLPQDRAPPAVA